MGAIAPAMVKRRRETPEQRRRREDDDAVKAEIAKAVLAEMPTFEEARDRYRAGRATAVETFLVTHTPTSAAYRRQQRFREDFAAVLVEVAGLATGKSRG